MRCRRWSASARTVRSAFRRLRPFANTQAASARSDYCEARMRVILFGFAGGIMAWAHFGSVSMPIRTRRQVDNHELRISAIEKQSAEAATSMRAVESTLKALSKNEEGLREMHIRQQRNRSQ